MIAQIAIFVLGSIFGAFVMAIVNMAKDDDYE